MNLFQEFEERKIDYANVRIDNWFTTDWAGESTTVSIIIPVNGRTQFNNIISSAFKRAIAWYNRKINGGFTASLTFVEHNEKEEHYELCADWVNYIFVPQNGHRFNKCLCFNVGVLKGVRAEYYLFHDSDILVPENFFELLFENMKDHDAVQAFSGQRLFHIGRELTENILCGRIPADELATTTKDVMPARAGAEGGSIFCTKEIVLGVGGFSDWAYDEYSVEDAAFWRYINLMGRVGFCNNPPIDAFHMWHEASFNRQTKSSDWERYRAFMSMNDEGKRHLLKLQSDHFNKYFNE